MLKNTAPLRPGDDHDDDDDDDDYGDDDDDDDYEYCLMAARLD